MICFFCGKEIGDEPKFFFGVDRPIYANIPVHRSCVPLLEEEGLEKYFYQNQERVYSLVKNFSPPKNKSLGRKKAKI
jgi:hypothetical protein